MINTKEKKCDACGKRDFSVCSRYDATLCNSCAEEKEVRTFTWYADGGHAWLQVPLAMLNAYGIAGDISAYSYKAGAYAYLEEDCDASTFVQHFEFNTGVRWSSIICDEVYHESSPVRNFQHYKAF